MVGSDTAHSCLSSVRSWGRQGWSWAPHSVQGPSSCLETLPAPVSGLLCHNRRGKDRAAHGGFSVGLPGRGVHHFDTYPSAPAGGRSLGSVPFLLTEMEKINSTENKSRGHRSLNFSS